MEGAGPPPEEIDDLTGRLLGDIVAIGSRPSGPTNFRFTPSGSVVLEGLTRRAAFSLLSEGTAGDPEVVRNAETSLLVLVGLAGSGEELESLAGRDWSLDDVQFRFGDLGEIDGQALASVLDKLCPGFWPIC